ncbi:MAG TPA: UPF0182 family protein, partial [Candidatus Limnocylindria bacterium]|nr:UPF0182 family protein [Candidatus Limnocylindria bacterium]
PRGPRGPRRARGDGGDRDDGGDEPWQRWFGGGEGRPSRDAEVSWRRWLVIGGLVVAALVVLGLLGGALNLITDLMWYGALGREEILLTRLTAQLALFALGFVAFLVLALVSIVAARRLAPRSPVRRIGDLELPDASRALTYGIAALAVLFALGSGAAWAGNWQTVLLFVNGGEWGTTDPTLGRDVGFYVFDLPFWRFVQGWGVFSLVVIGLLTLGTYAAQALRWRLQLTAPVRAHLSVLGALVLLGIGLGYQLDIPELAYSTRGVQGTIRAATYTDVTVQQPAHVILTVVALLAAALLVLNTWFRTLWLLALAGGAWLVASVVVGGLVPYFVQRLAVEPNELSVERPYIANHIAATRAAFDLDAIEVRPFTGEETLSRELLEENQATIENLRLWDYRPLLTTFGQQQILRQYYAFLDVDIDRYPIAGEVRQIMLSARELDVERLADAARTWTNERLVFTHGYGITAVPVDGVTPEGQPDYLVSGINRDPQLPVGQPRIYFGEATDTYVVTGTTTAEFDYPLGDEGGETTSWQARTGVGIGNPLARLLFALRFGDLNLLISNQLTGDSQILFRRDIAERVPELAPFLAYDGDPYLVSADERLVWMWDAYTLTDRYPNAQPLSAASRFPGANYVRNSVKVAVDAYDGSVRFFVADPEDPIAAAYGRIFPGLLEPMDAMPEALRAHLRYPEDLFNAQNEAYLLYHVEASEGGASTFYNQEDRWAFPTLGDRDGGGGGGEPIEPYYVIMRIPGEAEAEFVLIQPLVAAARPNMVAWVAARMEPDVYGERISFRFPSDTTTQGPAQVQARIEQDDTISSQFSLWDRAGSEVIRGNLLVLPMGDSMLYAEPIFLQSTQARFPEFVRIILVGERRIAFAETIEDALRQVLGEAPLPPPEEEPPPEEPGEEPGELPADVAGLVAEAQQLYAEAQAALEDGDLGTYQARVDELARVLDALAELTGASPAPQPSP